jgi:hypothetical protein
MKLRHFLTLAATAFAFAGCSSAPQKVSTGSIQARTFSFVKPARGGSAAYADDREAVHSMIQKAIANNLAQRGISRVASGGDVLVGHLVVIGNNVSTETITDYFGYGGAAAELEDKAHEAYIGTGNPARFDAGTLLIDITDGKTFKVLKRSWATRPLLKNLSPGVKAARIQEVVDEVLKDLRVAR